MKTSKKAIVSPYPNGKSQTQLSQEYGLSLSAINKWMKRYSEIKTEDGDIFTAAHIKELQKRFPIHATLKQGLDAVHKLRT